MLLRLLCLPGNWLSPFIDIGPWWFVCYRLNLDEWFVVAALWFCLCVVGTVDTVLSGLERSQPNQLYVYMDGVSLLSPFRLEKKLTQYVVLLVAREQTKTLKRTE